MSRESKALAAAGDEVASWYEGLKEPHPVLVVISGPSGVGKDVTIQRMKQRGHAYHFVVTATTRARRDCEVDGVDYHFVSKARFQEMVERGELLEHAKVYNDYKGIPKEEVTRALQSGQDALMRIDVQGAATIRQLVPQAVTIFLTAESDEALVERLRRRRSESEEDLAARIATARAELQRVHEFEYVVVNRECQLDETVDEVIAIIQAEKARLDWQMVTL